MGGRELATQILPRGSHATSTTSYPCSPAQGPRMVRSVSSISLILNEACTTSATINMGTPGQKICCSSFNNCSSMPQTQQITFSWSGCLYKSCPLPGIRFSSTTVNCFASVKNGLLILLSCPQLSTSAAVSIGMINFPAMVFLRSL